MITLSPVHPDLSVTVDSVSPALAPEVQAEVDRLWAEACRRRPLYEGKVYSIDCVSPERIHGHFVPYRQVIAQFADRRLAPRIGVRQLGVTGMLTCRQGIVLGRRAATVTHDPGLWEPVPSGAIDPDSVGAEGMIDIARQLLAELQEELNLSSEAVGSPRPILLATDPNQFVTDVVLSIDCHLDADQIRTAHSRASGEYSDLVILPPHRWDAFAAAEQLSPLCSALLNYAGNCGKETLTGWGL